MKEFIRIKNYSVRLKAEMHKNLLEANGIKAVFTADDAGGMRPDLMMTSGGVWLLVSKDDAEKSLRILKEE